MDTATETTPIRQLMPDGYLNTISSETGMAPTNICTVVNNENRNSYIWPAVERLAKENDSKAYAARIEFLKKRDQQRLALKQSFRTRQAA